ncbi:hypothetical protein GCM10010994_18780 [Chelatococcus reniformis]|uniref:Uncharacterized protein n=1 Tax=Chelatococcus reniformis TaxID=1494448 RepID=A0A916U4V4_9HYPH|nr:hypothetical protein GCM10010994_18780 [Chelatococcus reniformis]
MAAARRLPRRQPTLWVAARAARLRALAGADSGGDRGARVGTGNGLKIKMRKRSDRLGRRCPDVWPRCRVSRSKWGLDRVPMGWSYPIEEKPSR